MDFLNEPIYLRTCLIYKCIVLDFAEATFCQKRLIIYTCILRQYVYSNGYCSQKGVPLTDWPGCGVLGVVTVWDPAALVEWVGDQLALRR